MNTRSIQRALNGRLPQEGVEHITREPVMRIGTEFQALVPELEQHSGDPNSASIAGGTGSVVVWAPSEEMADEDVDTYLKMAKEQFGYGAEQALGLLYWHNYRIDKAVEDLPNFCPLQDKWSMEDKVIFEQAFQFHGKNFQRIRAMLPDKPISALVKYYYLWKRSYAQYSLMDKHARKNGRRISAGIPVSNDDADSTKSGSSRSDNHPQLQPTFHHPHPIMLVGKGKQLPKGIYLSTSELVELANTNEPVQLKYLDRNILELKEVIQRSKQEFVKMKEKWSGSESLEAYRPTDFSKKTGATVPTRWSEEEIEIALSVIREHGKDYEALSNALEGKTVPQCKNFFTNYKRKLNLPRIIAEYEIKHGQKLSRYSKQAKELVENGGRGLGEEELLPQYMLGVKRPRLQGSDIGMEMGHAEMV